MIRKIISSCTLLSVVLCAGLVCWWASAAGRVDQVSLERSGSQSIRLWAHDGQIVVTRTVQIDAIPESAGSVTWTSTPSQPAGDMIASAADGWLPVAYTSQPLRGKNGVETMVVAPMWLLVAITAILPALWVFSRIKPAKKKPHA
jgi:hypothetical protein